MAAGRVTSKCIISNGKICIKRGFVSATNPSLKEKIDVEKREKIGEAAETVKDGTKDIVQEVKRVGHAITDQINTTGNRAGGSSSEDSNVTQKGKDILGSIKNAAQDIKDKITNK